MRIFLSLIFILVVSFSTNAQDKIVETEGVVSFVTSQNVYVKFVSAKKIKSGDKLFIKQNGTLIPAIVVDYCSSTSCVGKFISSTKLKEGDKLIAQVPEDKIEKSVPKPEQQLSTAQQRQENPIARSASPVDSFKSAPLRKAEVTGRIGVSSYSNFSNLPGSENHRLRYTFNLDASHISGSRLSFNSYIVFTHKLNDWAPIKADIFNGLKIYDLSLKYEIGKSTAVSIGRKINPKIASLGALDGIQVEAAYKYFFWGVAGGLRPKFEDYGFDPKLPEFGAYFGQSLQNKNGIMQTTFAAFEQTNSGNIDRRFAYFQHDNSLIKNINLFVSSELELYKLVNGLPVNQISLTSFYASVNWRMSRKLSVTGSYDNRKNVIYYQTFKNYLDQLIDDASRQGVQFRLNFRPINYMNLGISSSYRLRDKDILPTKNVNGFLSYAKMPFNISATLSGNILQTSYINGNIYGLRLDKSMISGVLNLGLNYRYVDYQYVSTINTLQQHIAAADLSIQISRKFSLSFNYEGTFEKVNKYHSIYFSAIQRF